MLRQALRSCRRAQPPLCEAIERNLSSATQPLGSSAVNQGSYLAAASRSIAWSEISSQCFGHHIAQYASKAGKRHAKAADEAAAVDSSLNLEEVEGSMQRPLEHLQSTLSSMRTGRASAGMLDTIKVDAYGDRMPLKGVASVTVKDAQSLSVSVFDPSTLHAVEKAIRASPLGLNPRIDNQDIRVPVPKPTKQTLDAMAKLLKREGESAKVSIRQARKNAMDIIKRLDGEDDRKKAEKQVQTVTDKYIKEVDSLTAAKEKDLKNAL